MLSQKLIKFRETVKNINNAFSNNSRIKINDIPYTGYDNSFGTLIFNNITPFYFDSASSLPSFTFDFNYSFNTKNYSSINFYNNISISGIHFDLKQKIGQNTFNFGNSVDYGDYINFNYSNEYGFIFDLSLNIPTSSSYRFYYNEISKNFLKITPVSSIYATTFDISFVSSKTYVNAGGYYLYSDCEKESTHPYFRFLSESGF